MLAQKRRGNVRKLAARVRRARLALGVSQERFSELLGCSRRFVGNLESGNGGMPIRAVVMHLERIEEDLTAGYAPVDP